MRVYRWKKPELTVSLVAGGTIPDGTYWVSGYLAKATGHIIAPSSFSPRPDLVQVTLSGGYNSIDCSLSVRGSISITNAGSGKLLITSQFHCLEVGNTVSFTGTTNYNNTYTVTDWVSYNQFKVTGNYVADEAGTFICSTLHNTATCTFWYIYTSNPIDSGGRITINPRPVFTVATNTKTTALVTSLPAANSATQISDSSPVSRDLDYLKSDGLPLLYGTESAATVTNFNNEVISAGISHLANFTFNQWFVNINIEFANLLSTFNPTTNSVAIVFWTGQLWKTPNAVFLNHQFTVHGSNIGASSAALPVNRAMELIADDCAFNFIGFNTYAAMNVINYDSESIIACHITNAVQLSGMQLLLLPSAAISGGLKPAGVGTSRTMENMSGIFYFLIQEFGNVVYSYKNIKHLSLASTYDYQQYNQSGSVKICNADTLRANNEKKVSPVNNLQSACSVSFYREKSFFVYDALGGPIDNANVVITQASNVYSGVTDNNGKVVLTALEQQSVSAGSGASFINTLYFDFTITVSKNGYETYTSKSYLPKNIEEQITLKPVVKTRYTFDGKPFRALLPEAGSSSKLVQI